MVVPPFHTPKWSFLVGKPHGCWVPPFLGTPPYASPLKKPWGFCFRHQVSLMTEEEEALHATSKKNLGKWLVTKGEWGILKGIPSRDISYFLKLFIWMFPKIVVPPKSSIKIGVSLINHPFRGTPIFGNTHIWVLSQSLFFPKNFGHQLKI